MLLRNMLTTFAVLATLLVLGAPARAFDLPGSEDVTFEVGGRIMADWAAVSADDDLDDAGDFDGFGTEFRRVRFFMAGELYDHVFFKSQIDFADSFNDDGKVDAKDVYIGIKKLPVLGKIQFGHFKQPFMLEELTSSKYITFMERSTVTGAFSQGRDMGVAVGNAAMDGKLTYALGFFEKTDDGDEKFDNTDDFTFTGRVTFAPIMDKGSVVHLGGGYSHNFLNEDKGGDIRFRARPAVHLSAERLADTGSIPADGVDRVNGEAAVVFGPFSAQTEGVYTMVTSDAADDPSFWGAYGFVSFFATGESRPYKNGSFGRVKPNSNFNLEDGTFGALELAARVSYLNLEDTDGDADIEGGKLTTFTVGPNWYLNPYTRIMLNYVYSSVEDSNAELGADEGSLNAVQMRFQVDF